MSLWPVQPCGWCGKLCWTRRLRWLHEMRHGDRAPLLLVKRGRMP
jgi:hypothetical protein